MLLPVTQNFTKLIPTAALAFFYLCAFYLLTFVADKIPIAIMYATWSGLGIFTIAILGYMIGYIAIGWLSWGWWIAIAVIFSHAASGANWVISTVLLQERSEDEWRGRMFSTDFLLLTTVNGLSTLLASSILEYSTIGLRELVQIFAVGQVLTGIIWVMLIAPGERQFLEEMKTATS